MKRLFTITLLLLLCVACQDTFAGMQTFYPFTSKSVAGGANYNSSAMPIGDTTGNFSLEGTITGDASPDHSITVTWSRSDGTNTFASIEGTVVSAFTGTVFNYNFSPEFCSHMVLNVANAGGKETAIVTLRLCVSMN